MSLRTTRLLGLNTTAESIQVLHVLLTAAERLKLSATYQSRLRMEITELRSILTKA